MDRPGLPRRLGSPQPTRGGPTVTTAPNTAQGSAAPKAGDTATDQLESIDTLTKLVVLTYAAEANRLGFIDKDEVTQLVHLTGQPADVIASVSRKFYIVSKREKLTRE